MKQVLAFIRWNFSNLKWHDYLWMISCGMVGAGWNSEGLLFFSGLAIMLAMAIGGLITLQWRRWKMEREQLLDTIKDSK
jgi:hypothetical protein